MICGWLLLWFEEDLVVAKITRHEAFMAYIGDLDFHKIAMPNATPWHVNTDVPVVSMHPVVWLSSF